jgi:cellulose synthase/poly-beta-1,6-N-acetylglucosamine synthase-like glycosyltransferase
MTLISIIFWSSGFFIFYSYFGYPLLLCLLAPFIKRVSAETSKAFEPKVTLFISVYNEEKGIEEKILNTLHLNYPKKLLEVVVVSDGSNDRTDDIVSKYENQGVRLRHYAGRIGKTACLNQAVPLAEGEIVVFSDANSKYDREAIKSLVRHFQDREIGFVTGMTKYISDKDGLSSDIGLYWKIEQMTKVLESKIGSCIGADGAIFAIRKELYRPLQSYDINDFVIPLRVIEQGYRGVLDSDAFCIEETAGGKKEEFGRQVRITNRTIRAIVNHAYLLNPFGYSLLSFELFSHKVCRLLVPFVMFVFLIANLFLTTRVPFYRLVFYGQLLFYILAMLSYLNVGFKITFLSRIASLSHTFTMAIMAILSGWVKYLRGDTSVVWVPSRK